MLEGIFYSTISYSHIGNDVKASLKLNRESSVFAGHFPDMPVVPGVCSIQMIQELIEKAISKKIMLINADNIKFLGIINPEITPEIDIEITYRFDDQGNIITSAVIVSNETIFLKFKGIFKC